MEKAIQLASRMTTMALSTGRGSRVRVGDGRHEASGRGAGTGHEHVHVQGEVQQAVVEAEHDAVRVEVGGGVVAEEFGIAEDEAGAMVVIGIPGGEGQRRGEQCGDPAEMRAAALRSRMSEDMRPRGPGPRG